MLRKLFRPGKGQVASRFIAAFCNGTAVYRGDYVVWDTTAPGSQGAATDGVVDGQTLGDHDFVYVTHSTAATDSLGLHAGVVEGEQVSNRDTTTAMTDNGIVIVQTYGVFQNHCQVSATTVVAKDHLLGNNANAGVLTISTAATIINANYIPLVGMALTADTAYTRAAVTDAVGVTAFIRCDG